MQKIIDISVPVSKDIPVWEGDPAVKISSAASIGNGDIANVSFLNMGAHTGTHVDAPVHFVQGRTGVDQMPLETLIGEAYVVDLSGVVGEVHAEDFEKAGVPEGTRRLLCKTSNSSLWSRFPDSFYRDLSASLKAGRSGWWSTASGWWVSITWVWKDMTAYLPGRRRITNCWRQR